MKELQLGDKMIHFKYADNARCFMSTEYINDIQVNFEIYEDEYNQEQIDWERFKEFISVISKNNSLPALLEKSQKLLLALADAFGNSIEASQKIDDYHMVFCGLQFKGITDNLFAKGLFDFSLWFTIENKENPGEYVDPYGAYITDIEGRFITGARRAQC